MARREIRGHRAVVTGASSGIGRALAVELARQGTRLVVTARREERLRELVDEIGRLGGEAHPVVGDIVDPELRSRLVDTCRTQLGGLDFLINNAGVGATGLFEKADPARLRQIMEVNFFALAEMTRTCLPLLLEGHDPIVVNVSSILGRRGVPHNAEYCASKFAVVGFSESIRTELYAHGIDVMVVNPGTTETEFFDQLLEETSKPAWPEHGAVTAEVVARQTVRAIRRGKHEIVPYFWGKTLCWLNRISPRLVDRIMTRYV